MLLAAYDTATVTGWCVGQPGSIPRSGSVRLKNPDDDRDVAAFNMLAFLRDTWTLETPDLVCVEAFLNPAAQKSADAIILQIMVYGVIVAMCRAYGIRYEAPHRMTIVKHFCGELRSRDRDSIKAAVIQRGITLGYLPKGCRDNNRGDAAALWDFGCAHFCRTPPKTLVMFGERAEAT